MVARGFAILIAPCLPTAALVLSLGPAHTRNDLIAGVLAVILSSFALVDRRAGVACALVAFWVALAAFVLPSTLTEEVVAVSWAAVMGSCMIGPFSDAPRVERIAALPARPPSSKPTERRFTLAA